MSGSNLPHYPQQQPQPPGNAQQYPAQPAVIGWQPIYAAPPKLPISGVRVATGIVAILAGNWAALPAIVELSLEPFDPGFIALALIGSVSAFVLGIVQLAKSRSRGPAIPVTLMSLCGAGVLLSGARISVLGLNIPWTFNMLSCMTVVILAAIALVTGMRDRNMALPNPR